MSAEPVTPAAYEAWAATYCPLDADALSRKRERMAGSAFAFLRGSFFRWPFHYAAVAERFADAPHALCIGDIHVENFGTWRDSEGRLVWGANDFDEAAHLPLSSDLVRLAVSACLAEQLPKKERLKFSGEAAAAALLVGYRRAAEPRAARQPFVLEDRHPVLRNLCLITGEDAQREWHKLASDEAGNTGPASADAAIPRALLLTALQSGSTEVQIRWRLAGLGSLGRPRYVAIADWRGGLIAREAKAAVPSAVHVGESGLDPLGEYRRLLAVAPRAPDPHFTLVENWIIRRLSPEARKIELGELRTATDFQVLFEAMGGELANVHVAALGRPGPIAEWLATLPEGWLAAAAAKVARRIEKDWERFREG